MEVLKYTEATLREGTKGNVLAVAEGNIVFETVTGIKLGAKKLVVPKRVPATIYENRFSIPASPQSPQLK